MKKKILILTMSLVATLCALGRYVGPASDPIPTLEGPADPDAAGGPAALWSGTVISSTWQTGSSSPGAYISVQVVWASGSNQPDTKWSLDNSPLRYSMGTTVTGVSCAPHTVKFFPPAGSTGPSSNNFSANASNDNQKRVLTIDYD